MQWLSLDPEPGPGLLDPEPVCIDVKDEAEANLPSHENADERFMITRRLRSLHSLALHQDPVASPPPSRIAPTRGPR